MPSLNISCTALIRKRL